ncbi:MAG: hypothetical protein ACTSU5_11950 [Promethearchaeota archaeon]
MDAKEHKVVAALRQLAQKKVELEASLESLKKQVLFYSNDLENGKIDGDRYRDLLVQNSEAQDLVAEQAKFVEHALGVLSDVTVNTCKQFETSLIKQLDEVNNQIAHWNERKEWLGEEEFEERARELGNRQRTVVGKIEIIQGILRSFS